MMENTTRRQFLTTAVAAGTIASATAIGMQSAWAQDGAAAARPGVLFSQLPTPLEHMPRLSAALGGAQIWVKRDDCTGLAMGGNKARKLDKLMADAKAQGADTVITSGGLQSNHCRQTAAAAAIMGMKCILVQSSAGPNRGGSWYRNANTLLNRIFDAEIRIVPAGSTTAEVVENTVQSLTADGAKPYVIPGGGSNAIGAEAYAEAFTEALGQADGLGVKFDRIVHSTGSGGTQSGLVVGAALNNSDTQIFGVATGGAPEPAHEKITAMSNELAGKLNLANTFTLDDITVRGGFNGGGYGVPSAEMREAVELTARTEGLLLDPTYTGKAMAALIALVRSGEFSASENILFWHTGGTTGLFGYEDQF